MKREIKFDILKVTGLICIVLAHVNPPKIIFQFRNFDVVLMVLISAYLGLKSYNKNKKSCQYIIKRFNRLILPTWIFITLFFILTYIANLVFDYKMFSIKRIIGTYALSDYSIGFVWIIRIYFVISILILLYEIIIRYISEKYMIYISSILFIIYEMLCHLGLFNNFFVQYFFAYIIPCFFLLCLSKHIFSKNKKKNVIIGILSFLILIVSGFIIYKSTGEIQQTQVMKYPFRAYYLSYGILISIILLFLVNNKFILNIFNNKITIFISAHSLWIYLWHILFIYILKSFDLKWYLEFVLLIVLSCLVVYIQSFIVLKIESKYDFKVLKIFKG